MADPILKASYPALDDIPETYRPLFSTRDEDDDEIPWELTEIEGMKTAADVDRLDEALRKEKSDHAAARVVNKSWAALKLKPEEALAQIDRIPELEARAEEGGASIDEPALNELAKKRALPFKREVERLQTELNSANALNKVLSTETRTRTILDKVRVSLIAAKVLPDAQDDALLLAERDFEIDDTGEPVTKVGGMDPSKWLDDLKPKWGHWWPASKGGGSKGSGGSGGGPRTGNPWAEDSWNFTEQGRVVREQGQEAAQKLAKSAGTTVGGLKPKAKVKA